MSSSFLSSLINNNSNNSYSLQDMQTHTHSSSASSSSASPSQSPSYTFDSSALFAFNKYQQSLLHNESTVTPASVVPNDYNNHPYLSPFAARALTGNDTPNHPPPLPSLSANPSLSVGDVFHSVKTNARCKGNSCHQCKTNKEPPHLYFCTSKTDNPLGKRNCRKKYCVACMSRWYKGLLNTGLPGHQPPSAQGWQCPSCCNQCVCAACDRKKEKEARSKKEANKNNTLPTLPPSINSENSPSSQGYEGSPVSDVMESLDEPSSSEYSGMKRDRHSMRSTSGSGNDSTNRNHGGSDADSPPVSPYAKQMKMEISPLLSSTSNSTIPVLPTNDTNDRARSASGEVKTKPESPMFLPNPPTNRSQNTPRNDTQTVASTVASATHTTRRNNNNTGLIQPAQAVEIPHSTRPSSSSSHSRHHAAIDSIVTAISTGPSSASRPPLSAPGTHLYHGDSHHQRKRPATADASMFSVPAVPTTHHQLSQHHHNSDNNNNHNTNILYLEHTAKTVAAAEISKYYQVMSQLGEQEKLAFFQQRVAAIQQLKQQQQQQISRYHQQQQQQQQQGGYGSSNSTSTGPSSSTVSSSTASVIEELTSSMPSASRSLFGNSNNCTSNSNSGSNTGYQSVGNNRHDEVPSLTSLSSSNSSSSSTPNPSTQLHSQHGLTGSPSYFGLSDNPAAAYAVGSGDDPSTNKLALGLPLIGAAGRAMTVPVTIGENDRHTAVRAMTSIGSLNFDSNSQSVSLLGTPALCSPAISSPSSPRSIARLTGMTHATALDSITGDPFNPSPLFNPALVHDIGINHIHGTNTPHFWLKSGGNSLVSTPKHGLTNNPVSGSMGELEFQALFN